jgi:hypothetical protein
LIKDNADAEEAEADDRIEKTTIVAIVDTDPTMIWCWVMKHSVNGKGK